MFGFLADKAKALSEAVSETVVSAKDAVLNSVGEGANVATEYLEKNWPQIERVVVDGLLTVTHDRIKDDEAFCLLRKKLLSFCPRLYVFCFQGRRSSPIPKNIVSRSLSC